MRRTLFCEYFFVNLFLRTRRQHIKYPVELAREMSGYDRGAAISVMLIHLEM
jgi:hypothetical protein